MTEPPSSKRIKMADGAAAQPVIGTHNGHFHADEALAVYLLRLLPQYRNASLVRTRDPDVLQTCTVVVDVGGVHDDALLRYDHHQREFATTFPDHHTKLSSAGLVWMHFGTRIIAAVTGLAPDAPDTLLLHTKIYDDLIEAFDANDNGIPAHDPQALRGAGIAKRFADSGFTLASVVSRYNRAPVHTPHTAAELAANPQAEEDIRFLRASTFVGEQFDLELADKFQNWLPVRALVADAFAQRTTHDPSGQILVLPHRDGGVPWSDHLYALETRAGCPGQVLYALFAESAAPDSKWRIRAVGLEPGSFENRQPLPEPWRGLRDDELSQLAGVPGCVFVHASGFIGGNRTFDGALAMAQKALAA